MACKAAYELTQALNDKPITKTKEQIRDLTKLSNVFGNLAATNKPAAEVSTHQAPSPVAPKEALANPWRKTPA